MRLVIMHFIPDEDNKKNKDAVLSTSVISVRNLDKEMTDTLICSAFLYQAMHSGFSEGLTKALSKTDIAAIENSEEITPLIMKAKVIMMAFSVALVMIFKEKKLDRTEGFNQT